MTVTSKHDQAHATLLAEVLAHETSSQDPRWLAQLTDCPQCAKEHAELAEIAADLAAERHKRDRLLEQAQRETSAEQRELVRSILERARATPSAGQQPPRTVGQRSWSLWALAAALLALIGLGARQLWLGATQPTSGAQEILLGGEIELAYTVDAAQALHLRWRAAAPALGWYNLEVREAGKDQKLLLRQEHLESATWSPTPEEQQLLSGNLRIEVQAFDAVGDALGAGFLVLRLPLR